ncbi:hypothetical protein [Aureispira sp. CCB-QB1]|uniref:hypothetical protein n=1 Tax=Aureispira sp. CCB-QB1 TaxID=1313421 RepID=UPI000697DF6A|nr:hypothetical protein [Aureispira sp. CCB-QB1]
MKYSLIYLQLLIIGCSIPNKAITQKYEIEYKKEAIQLYYQFVHKAELALIDNEFQIALDNYLLAEQKRTLFIRDALNALTTSIEIKKYDVAIKFAKQLILKGLPYTYFEKKVFFQDFIETQDWASLKNARIESKINLQLRKKIDSLCKRDQEFRSDYEFYIDTIIAIDTLIKSEVLNIFATHGYPSSELTGIIAVYPKIRTTS